MSQSRLIVSEAGDVTAVRFADRHIRDEMQIQEWGDALLRLVDADHQRLVLDFADVDTLSSSALGALVTLNRKLQSTEGKMVLCGIRPSIQEVFAITKLNTWFTIAKDEAEALAQLAAPEKA